MGKYDIKICKDRIAEAQQRLLALYEGRETDQIPFSFSVEAECCEAWMPGNNYNFETLIRDPDKAIEGQILSINWQTDHFPDSDLLPMFKTFYLGEGIVPSMFGAKQLVVPNDPPYTEGRILESIYDVEKLPLRIDPLHDGWGKMLKDVTTKFLHATNCQVPVEINDHQSPYGVATKLIGNEDLIFAMYDEPALVHKLMGICTQAIIDCADAMISYCGKENVVLNPTIGIPGYDSIILWDDYISVLTPELHSEFCQPYNNKIYERFGRGHLHTCGPYFPGFIDAALACKPISMDISFMRGLAKPISDMVTFRRITKENGIILNGGLSTCEVSSFENTAMQPVTKEIFDIMKDGGLIWREGGSKEYGKELQSWLHQ